MSDRTYSEREVAAIIERAAHAQKRDTDPDAPGLTLAEIERVGREAGLDPVLLRRAAAEVDAGLLSGEATRPGSDIAERWVDAPLRPGAWEDAVAMLRLRIGAPVGAAADTGVLGDTREWVHTAPMGVKTTVSVSPREGGTRIRVMMEDGAPADLRPRAAIVGAVASFLPAFLTGALLAEVVGWSDLAAVGMLLLIVLIGTAAATPILSRRGERRRVRQSAEAQRLADDLARQLAAPVAGAERDASRLDASLLDEEPAPGPERAPGPRRTRA